MVLPTAKAGRKRILYFHHAIGLGGAPRSLSLLIDGLNKTEFEPLVVMPRRNNNEPVSTMFKNAGAKVIEEQDIRPFNGSTVAPCKTLKDRAYAVLSINKLTKTAKKLAAELQPDLVHLNSTCLVGAAKGVHQANPNTPVIAHVREPLLTNWWGRWLAKMNRRHIDWFVGIDQFGLDSIGLSENRGDVVYNFVNLKEFSPASETIVKSIRKSSGWELNRVVFLSLSRVAPSNGALELSHLIQKCDSQLDPNALFVIAGFHDSNASKYETSVKILAKESARIQTLPFSRDVIGLISSADVVIAPFITPHSARSVFEAAAIGMPAIVSDLPNLRELIMDEQTGFSYDWNKEDSFIDAINRLCDKTVRQRMGQRAKALAAQKFDQEKNIQQTVAVYQKLLNR